MNSGAPAPEVESVLAQGSPNSVAREPSTSAEAAPGKYSDTPSAPELSPQRSLDDALRHLDQFPSDEKRAALKFAQSIEPQFPSTGVQAEARTAKEITLLVDLNRMPEARALVRKFIQQHPDSRYRPLVQGVTGIHPRPTGPTP